MGKGDIKTRKGKIVRGSYGKTRPRKKNKPSLVQKTEGEKGEKLKTEAKKPKTTKKKEA